MSSPRPIDVMQHYSSSEDEASYSSFEEQENSMNPFIQEFDETFARIREDDAKFAALFQAGGLQAILESQRELKPAVVISMITHTTTVTEFYNCVTDNGKYFDYYIDAEDLRSNSTALAIACEVENLPLAAALLAMGANPNRINIGNRKPIGIAKELQNQALVDLLYAANAKDDFNPNNPENIKYARDLKDAVVKNNIDEARKILTEHGEQLDLTKIFIKMSHCCTREAVQNGNLQMVQLLAEYGDDYIESTVRANENNISLAREKGFADIADFLEQKQRAAYDILKQYKERSPLLSHSLLAVKNAEITSDQISPATTLKG